MQWSSSRQCVALVKYTYVQCCIFLLCRRSAFNFTIEVVDGKFLGAAFNFLNRINVTVSRAERANVGTGDAFVMGVHTVSQSDVEWPLNIQQDGFSWDLWYDLCTRGLQTNSKQVAIVWFVHHWYEYCSNIDTRGIFDHGVDHVPYLVFNARKSSSDVLTFCFLQLFKSMYFTIKSISFISKAIPMWRLSPIKNRFELRLSPLLFLENDF